MKEVSEVDLSSRHLLSSNAVGDNFIQPRPLSFSAVSRLMRTDAKSQSMPFMPAAAAASVSTTLPRPARQQQHRQQQQQQQHLLLQQQQQQQLIRQQPQTNLNQALAIVANKWDREERRQEQEATRRMTVLKQRKISAILKVGNRKGT